jgi:hypothetical protein
MHLESGAYPGTKARVSSQKKRAAKFGGPMIQACRRGGRGIRPAIANLTCNSSGSSGPKAIVLSPQNRPVLEKTSIAPESWPSRHPSLGDSEGPSDQNRGDGGRKGSFGDLRHSVAVRLALTSTHQSDVPGSGGKDATSIRDADIRGERGQAVRSQAVRMVDPARGCRIVWLWHAGIFDSPSVALNPCSSPSRGHRGAGLTHIESFCLPTTIGRRQQRASAFSRFHNHARVRASPPR